jgi:hypothetical protein
LPLTVTRSQLRKYFQDWLDTGFRNGLINRNRRDDTVKQMTERVPALAASLNETGKATLVLGRGAVDLFLRQGRDPETGTFNLFEIRWQGRRRRQSRLRCFVGHRFLPPISDDLRMNLRYVLEPSNIELVWSGMDLAASGFFDDVVKRIKGCHFCIFDNRDTEDKPNVYIEAGIAYALAKPFVLANYKGNRVGMPSDLTHVTNLPYTSYKDLTKALYFTLPVFLRDTGLRRKR